MSSDSAATTGNREGGSWLDTQVEGRSFRFWIAVSVLIALVVLGVGAWWVWGLGRGMPTDDSAMTGIGEMPATEVRLPPVAGFYAGEHVFFAHPEASDPQVAGMLTDMMGGSPVFTVPQLTDVPPNARDIVYVFTSGVTGHGPFGFQADVFPSAPGDAGYSPLRTVVLVTWVNEDQARELRSADEVTAAADAGELDLEDTAVVVNMPFLTWPDGER